MHTTNTEKEFQEVFKRLDDISKKINSAEKKPENPWLDNQELMQLLKISRRTLQTYRDNNEIAFSMIGNKLYYKLSDVEDLLNRNYKKRLV